MNILEKIINELKLQIFSEEEVGDTKIIAIYPGRFQPMGLHHKTSYDWLANKFGKENTYIVTSDKTDPQRSPFNFNEKKKIINKHGIQNVVKVKNPYLPREIISKFDPKKTVIVYMIGEKDAGRLSGYKRLMKYNKTTLIPYKDIDNPYAYYVYAPHVKINIPSFGEMSGTIIRKALGDQEVKLSELKQRFKSIMGWFDADIFNMVIKKMNSNRGNLKEDLNEWMKALLNMTDVQSQLFFGTLKKEYGDTKDLLPIIRKFIKTGKLTDEEKKTFRKQMKDNLKLLGLGAIAAIPLPGTMLMIPVIIELAKKVNINLLPENTEPKKERLSIVRREFWDKVFEGVVKQDDFVICEECGEKMKQIQYRQINSSNKIDARQLLVCGGAAGHMSHPFDDMELTFGDMKEMFKMGLSGEITTTGAPSEKLDGQNLFVTFKAGKLYAARNKGDIKTGGMDYKSITTKFKGREQIERAFTYSFSDLEQAIQSLSRNQQLMIFKNGTVWMNLEILYPETENVINYDGAYIVFHGSAAYNKNGEKGKSYPEYANILAGMIKQVNAETQKTFSISKPKALTIEKSKKFEDKLFYYVSELTKLQNKMKCTDSDTLGMWHQKWWEKYIKQNVNRLGVSIDEKTMEGLVNRWAFMDKKFKLDSNNISNVELLNWAKEVDKTKYEEQQKKNIQPFDSLFLKFGADVLKNVKDVMSINPTKATNKIKTELETAIDTLSTSSDIKDLAFLKKQLKRIEDAGGMDAIVPLEGVVFNFKGKTYKLTGTFAPINQLLGYFKFGK
jgi:hypothetical protein